MDFFFRASDEAMGRWKESARKSGLTFSAWLREAADDKLIKTVAAAEPWNLPALAVELYGEPVETAVAARAADGPAVSTGAKLDQPGEQLPRGGGEVAGPRPAAPVEQVSGRELVDRAERLLSEKRSFSPDPKGGK